MLAAVNCSSSACMLDQIINDDCTLSPQTRYKASIKKTSTIIMAYRIYRSNAAALLDWTVAWTVLHGRVRDRICNAGTHLPNAFLEVTLQI